MTPGFVAQFLRVGSPRPNLSDSAGDRPIRAEKFTSWKSLPIPFKYIVSLVPRRSLGDHVSDLVALATAWIN